MLSFLTTAWGLVTFAGIVLGTNVHVNEGCVVIGSTTTCASNSVPVDGGAVTIYAQIDGSQNVPTIVPGCKLEATWPATFGDIFFGADNCLYDANANPINGQCCTATTTDVVTNPYYTASQCGGRNPDAKCPGPSCYNFSACFYACCQGPTPITNPLSCNSLPERCSCAESCGCCY